MLDKRVDAALHGAFPKHTSLINCVCRSLRANFALPVLLNRFDHSQVRRAVEVVRRLDEEAAARLTRSTYPLHPLAAFAAMPLMDELRCRRRIALTCMPCVALDWLTINDAILSGVYERYPGERLEIKLMGMFEGSFAAERGSVGFRVFFETDADAVRGKLTAPEELFA